MNVISCRPYTNTDYGTCLEVFDGNVPDYFAPEEREDLKHFLAGNPFYYRVCQRGQSIIGFYGLAPTANDQVGRIKWIMAARTALGSGIGSYMMQQSIQRAKQAGYSVVEIAASQKSAPFFAKFGAAEIHRTEEGWGPGLDRVDMKLIIL